MELGPTENESYDFHGKKHSLILGGTHKEKESEIDNLNKNLPNLTCQRRNINMLS